MSSRHRLIVDLHRLLNRCDHQIELFLTKDDTSGSNEKQEHHQIEQLVIVGFQLLKQLEQYDQLNDIPGSVKKSEHSMVDHRLLQEFQHRLQRVQDVLLDSEKQLVRAALIPSAALPVVESSAIVSAGLTAPLSTASTDDLLIPSPAGSLRELHDDSLLRARVDGMTVQRLRKELLSGGSTANLDETEMTLEQKMNAEMDDFVTDMSRLTGQLRTNALNFSDLLQKDLQRVADTMNQMSKTDRQLGVELDRVRLLLKRMKSLCGWQFVMVALVMIMSMGAYIVIKGFRKSQYDSTVSQPSLWSYQPIPPVSPLVFTPSIISATSNQPETSNHEEL